MGLSLTLSKNTRLNSLGRNRNRNLNISKALLKIQAHHGTSLFTSAATNQRGFTKVHMVKRSSGPLSSRITGGDRVGVSFDNTGECNLYNTTEHLYSALTKTRLARKHIVLHSEAGRLFQVMRPRNC